MKLITRRGAGPVDNEVSFQKEATGRAVDLAIFCHYISHARAVYNNSLSKEKNTIHL